MSFPLPAGYRGDGIETAPRAQLIAADQLIAEPAVTEAQVRSGATIQVDTAPVP